MLLEETTFQEEECPRINEIARRTDRINYGEFLLGRGGGVREDCSKTKGGYKGRES